MRAASVVVGMAAVGGLVFTAVATAATEQGEGSGVPCAPTADACVSLASDQAWLVRDGRIVAGPMRTTHGTDAEPTPSGTFAVQWKDADHVSGESAGFPMPDAVFFDGDGRAFHAGDVRSNSAGCIRLSSRAAELFYANLQPGDRVQILP